jgi:hypothetical protein
MAEFLKTDENVVEHFEKSIEQFAFPFDLKFVFVTNNKAKKLVKLSKISDQFSFLLDAHLLVTFNEDFYQHFDDQNTTILIEQEIDRIECDAEKNKVTLNNNPLISTSSGILEKFTLDLVKDANKLEREYLSQIKDKEKEDKDSKPKKKNKWNKN